MYDGSKLAGIRCESFPIWAMRNGIRSKKDTINELVYAVDDIRRAVCERK